MQIRLIGWLPRMSIHRIIQISRPSSSTYTRPVTAHLFFAPHASKLAESTELILDIPGGGFVSMTPEHHEERLCAWAEQTGKPVLSIDYGKAPECECGLLHFTSIPPPMFSSPDRHFFYLGDGGVAGARMTHSGSSSTAKQFWIEPWTLINSVTS